MKSNYRSIGDFIKLVDIRNKELKDITLVGVSINKRFIPSVANIIGSDMTNYKIIKKNQFACSLMQVRRDGKIPVALFEDKEAIISQAYPVFEIIDTNELLPQYLMMWMTRSEFDREACFYAIGGVRGSLEWEDFCSMKLPVPTLEKQKEIIKEYHTITDRIKLNEQLNQKLEDTAQSIYKEWFVNFEFPDENGKPYKSNGGEMFYCDELDREIPMGWRLEVLENLTNQICVGFVGSCFDYYCQEENGIPMLRTTDLTEYGISYKDLKYVTIEFHIKNKKSQLKKGDVLVARHGTNGMPAIFNEYIEANCLNVIIIKPNLNILSSKFIQIYLKDNETKEQIKSLLGGSVQDVLNTKSLANLKIIFPNELLLKKVSLLFDKLHNYIESKRQENRILEELLQILLSKIATIEG